MYLFERCIDSGSFHFLSNMNCYTENIFQNCSVIAPSRLLVCMFIYCSIAPLWFILFYAFALLISFLSCFKHKYEECPCELRCLNQLFKSPFFRFCLPACDRQTGAFSSAFLQLCTAAARLSAVVSAELRPQLLQCFRRTAEHLTVKLCDGIIGDCLYFFWSWAIGTHILSVCLDFLLLPFSLHKHRSTDVKETLRNSP